MRGGEGGVRQLGNIFIATLFKLKTATIFTLAQYASLHFIQMGFNFVFFWHESAPVFGTLMPKTVNVGHPRASKGTFEPGKL